MSTQIANCLFLI